MGLKALDVYQGDDWLTYRASVAQMFDILDRMRDLCRHDIADTSLLTLESGSMPFQLHMGAEGHFDPFGIIVELCDDLSGAMDAVQADLFPYLQKETRLRWSSFEMQLHIKDLRRRALEEYQASERSVSALDDVHDIIERLGILLRKIDQ